ncbi:GGDEF domain-containing protein [Salinibacter altiplanensis]|uniref:GGDEF domain-containing protein n=1 Tax=Salinibacter altiplanensis TaxID=1803181 RepID=UPI000C9ED170|nr:GGDEF domain-containing protein [Salinibacter altiplanensis]
MVRFLLVLLAVLVVGLAALFGRPWLYVATGLILVGGLGGLGWWLWTTYRQAPQAPERPRPGPDSDDPSLDELGIMDIQPQGRPPSASDAPPDETTAPHPQDAPSDTSSHPDASTPAENPPAGDTSTEDAPAPASASQPPRPAAQSTQEPADTEEKSVFVPLLETARVALDAQTVCLLVQEDMALTYRVEAIASPHPSIRRSGSFDTQTPLLTATMSRESVTYRSLTGTEMAIEDLGYYEDPPVVDHLSLAPVPQPDASTTTFLVADAPSDVDLGSSRTRTLLSHFADTVALLFNEEQSPEAPDPQPNPDGSPEVEDADMLAPNTNGTADADAVLEGDSDEPRPRRELIAEEMDAAQSASEPLALALVHLNRAESIARQGKEAVASAERLFQARLEQKAPNRRVERFGELTYGIFFRAKPDTVEPWISDFEAAMRQEEGQLEGGASVGVAMWTDETPEALRTAATEALREAYKTGTCTIVT